MSAQQIESAEAFLRRLIAVVPYRFVIGEIKEISPKAQEVIEQDRALARAAALLDAAQWLLDHGAEVEKLHPDDDRICIGVEPAGDALLRALAVKAECGSTVLSGDSVDPVQTAEGVGAPSAAATEPPAARDGE